MPGGLRACFAKSETECTLQRKIRCNSVFTSTASYEPSLNRHSVRSSDSTSNGVLTGARRLAASAQRLSRWRACLLWTASVLCAAIVLVGIDACIRREEVGLRFLFAAAWTLVAYLGALRWLIPAWRFSPSSDLVARWVEQQQPDLGNQLSTIVQLADLPPHETRFGSPQLRQQAMRSLAPQQTPPCWEKYLDTRIGWRALLALAFAMLVIASCCLLWPNESWVGIRRLALPWSTVSWPRADQLELVGTPSAVALGTTLQIEVIDRSPPLPDHVDLLLRDVEHPTERPVVIGARMMDDMAIVNLPVMEKTVEVRAIGGDDTQMAWHRIDVVQPPAIESHRYQVEPPDHTKQPSFEIVGKRIQVLSGSRIRFLGKLNEPVRQLTVRNSVVRSSNESGQKFSTPWKVLLDNNRRDFALGTESGDSVQHENEHLKTWLATESQSWQFVATTTQGINVLLPGLWSIEVAPDTRPIVSLKPSRLSEFAESADLPIQGQANDDVGLASVTAAIALGKLQSPDVESIVNGKPTMNGQTIPVHRQPLWRPELEALERNVSVEETLDLNQKFSVSAGQEVTVWLEAVDTLGQTGFSRPQTYIVRDTRGILDAVGKQQHKLLAQLQEIVQAQRRNMQLATRTADITQRKNAISPATVDALSSVWKIQSSLRSQLLEGDESLAGQLAGLAEIIQQNQISNSKRADEINRLRSQLDMIAAESMPAALNAAQAAYVQAKTLGTNSELADTTLQSAMEKSTTSQNRMLADLRSLLDVFSRGESVRQFQRDLVETLNQQRQLMQDTNNLHIQELKNPRADSTAAVSIELSADQLGLARQLDQLVQQARNMTSNSNLEHQLGMVASTLLEEHVSTTMRDAAENLSAGDFSDSASNQQTAIDGLESALEELGIGNSRASMFSGRAEQLRETAQNLSELAEQQDALAKSATRDNPDIAQSLLKDQTRLQDETQAQLANLEPGGNAQVNQGLANATQSQETTRQALAQGEMQAAAESAQQAAEQLAQSADELNRQSRQLDGEARNEQIFQLAAVLDRLIVQQNAVVDQMTELAEEPARLERPDANLKQRMREIAADQETVRKSIQNALAKTSELPAFHWTMAEAESDMSRAVASAQRFRIQPDALNSATSALRKLSLAADAIASSEPQDAPETAEEASDDSRDQPQMDQRLAPPIASLKLLRGLQSDINAQTKQLDQLPKNSAGRLRKLSHLRDQQASLGLQLQALLKELDAASDTNQE